MSLSIVGSTLKADEAKERERKRKNLLERERQVKKEVEQQFKTFTATIDKKVAILSTMANNYKDPTEKIEVSINHNITESISRSFIIFLTEIIVTKTYPKVLS